MKNIFIIGGVIVLVLFGGVWWSKSLQSADQNVITAKGLHWHPHLEIYIQGKKLEIPANIGVGPQYAAKPTYDPGMRMTAVHTHTSDGVIHFEFGGVVRKEDTELSNFFRIWGKNFMELGSAVAMTVNGKENTELEKYQMKDGDLIVLRYE